ncbi:hypothetical protein [Duganella sp. P38]|uniref:hypothetical protein n=1 Tax=Duganella sp. P38 TaxID=3423949 RepID=UPI003D793C22
MLAFFLSDAAVRIPPYLPRCWWCWQVFHVKVDDLGLVELTTLLADLVRSRRALSSRCLAGVRRAARSPAAMQLVPRVESAALALLQCFVQAAFIGTDCAATLVRSLPKQGGVMIFLAVMASPSAVLLIGAQAPPSKSRAFTVSGAH